MTQSSVRVSDVVAEFLDRCGVNTAFGIISVHNAPLMEAIHRRNALRFIMVRGEMGGAHMADAYARVTGGLGVLITSTGGGAASAASGLVEARFAGSPLLHITGQTSTTMVFARSAMARSHTEVGPVLNTPFLSLGWTLMTKMSMGSMKRR